MSDQTAAGERSSGASARGSDGAAMARCVAYAAWSELTASPHDLDPRPSLADKPTLLEALPFESGLVSLLEEAVGKDLEQLKFEYSGLFEVGDDGPPAPIREDLQTGQRAGTREDLVRFYDFFGYRLGADFAWAPDHLSVELEFMHFLCHRECHAQRNVHSYQLAQRDFAQRHLANWIPTLARQTAGLRADAMYGRVVEELSRFVISDLKWQNDTIPVTDEV